MVRRGVDIRDAATLRMTSSGTWSDASNRADASVLGTGDGTRAPRSALLHDPRGGIREGGFRV